MAHWVNYLPEVGRPIIKRGEELDAMVKDIGRMERELSEAQKRFAAAKADLEAEVGKFWSAQEIADANALAVRDSRMTA